MLLTSLFYSDDSISVEVQFNGVLTSAFATDIETGIAAVGHAKQSPEDSYDQTMGQFLAVYRAKARLYSKLAKYTAKHGV